MLACPIESSDEWKKTLADANGDRDAALIEWRKPDGFGSKDEFNLEVDGETFETERPGPTEPLEPEVKPDKFSKLIDDIKVYLTTQYTILTKKKIADQPEKQARLQKVIDDFAALEGVESITMFIDDAYRKSQLAKDRFAKVIANEKNLTSRELMQELSAINEFANGYSILDEINKQDIFDFFSEKVDPSIPEALLTPAQKLTRAIEIKNNINQQFVEIGRPLITEFLLDYKSENIAEDIMPEVTKLQEQIKAIKNDSSKDEAQKLKTIEPLQERLDKFQSFVLDKDSMIELLKEASSDESVFSYLIDPLISSKDAALGLFAKAIKSQLAYANVKNIETKNKWAKYFLDYADSTSISRNNVAEFNDGIYEYVEETYTDSVTGEIVTKRIPHYVQKYDMTAYNKAAKAEQKRRGLAPVLSTNPTEYEQKKLDKYNEGLGKWYSENKQSKPIEEIEAIIASKKKELEKNLISQKEYDDWYSSRVFKTKNGTIQYRWEMTQPSEKYLNPKWSALYDINGKPIGEKGKLHQFYLKTYFESQELLPDSQKLGYRLPDIPKEDYERILSNGLIDTITENFKDATQIRAQDSQQYGVATTSNLGVKFIPVHYTQKSLAPEDISLDLGRSMLLFSAMANRFHALNEVNAEISLFKTVVGANARTVAETNSKGEPIMNQIANKQNIVRFLRKNGESYSQKHVDDFIDMIVYGETQAAEELFGISMSKVTNTASGISAVTSLSLDALKGMANNLQGNIQMIIEANSGQFFAKSNLANGKGFYWSSVPSMLADFGQPTPTSLLGQLAEFYDAIQGEFIDQYGKKVTGTAALRLMSIDTIFFNQSFAEHEIQVSGMCALMDATMVTDKNTGEVISLLQAHVLYGAYGVAENTNFSEKKRQNFQNTLHALNKRMHGVYNEFDKGTSQKYSVSRLAIMYRKHLVPGYRRRFNDLAMDQELGTFTEGYYRTFWTLFAKDLLTFKWNMIEGWSTYTPFQKAQMKRVIAELSIIVTSTALISILKSLPDDDDDELKNNYAYNFALYEMVRMKSETASYIWLPDAYRVVRSPTAMTSTLERVIKFTNQFFLTWDPDELDFKRKSGVWDKGDNKSWAYFLKMIGYSGYNIKPGEAVESFEGTLKK